MGQYGALAGEQTVPNAEATALYTRESKAWDSTKSELQRALDSAAVKRDQLESSKAALKVELEATIQTLRAKCEMQDDR